MPGANAAGWDWRKGLTLLSGEWSLPGFFGFSWADQVESHVVLWLVYGFLLLEDSQERVHPCSLKRSVHPRRVRKDLLLDTVF